MYPAPSAHFSDGCIDIIYTNTSSTTKLLPLFTELEHGKHINNVNCHYIKCNAFRLLPNNTTKRSEILMDGERIKYQPIEVRVWRGIANIHSL